MERRTRALSGVSSPGLTPESEYTLKGRIREAREFSRFCGTAASYMCHSHLLQLLQSRWRLFSVYVREYSVQFIKR